MERGNWHEQIISLIYGGWWYTRSEYSYSRSSSSSSFLSRIKHTWPFRCSLCFLYYFLYINRNGESNGVNDTLFLGGNEKSYDAEGGWMDGWVGKARKGWKRLKRESVSKKRDTIILQGFPSAGWHKIENNMGLHSAVCTKDLTSVFPLFSADLTSSLRRAPEACPASTTSAAISAAVK